MTSDERPVMSWDEWLAAGERTMAGAGAGTPSAGGGAQRVVARVPPAVAEARRQLDLAGLLFDEAVRAYHRVIAGTR